LNIKRFASRRCGLCALLLCSGVALAQQEVTLTARVAVVSSGQGSRPHEAGGVVLWLTPAAGTDSASSPALHEPSHPRLVQHNKSFEPHVLVVPVGSMVSFPNRDPFFHNVFSLFEGKRFDLGLYEAGSTRDVNFDKPGISYIFCNIHPEMSAVVIALDTPYYGISDQRGEVVIPKVPAGRYTLRVWYEAALPETLKSMARDITVSEANSTLGVLRLTEVALPQGHKNLYGRDYDPPTPDNPAYSRP
jgi:plastocyanin